MRLILSCCWLEFWRLDTSCSCLEFRRLDTNYGWLHPTTDLNSGGWIRLKADSILRLAMSCGWFYPAADLSSGGLIQVIVDSILRLTTSCDWYYPASDLSSAGWTRLASDLYFNISSKFKHLFRKMHHFYGLFSTAWFQLPLIQVLAAALRTLKKLEKVWKSLKNLAATDSSCSGWFELRRLIQDLRQIKDTPKRHIS